MNTPEKNRVTIIEDAHDWINAEHLHWPRMRIFTVWFSYIGYWIIKDFVFASENIPAILCLVASFIASSLLMGFFMGEWARDREREARIFHKVMRQRFEEEVRGENVCSACALPVDEFKNAQSMRMFKLNGLCQACQNKM